jgi:hypothetical protein
MVWFILVIAVVIALLMFEFWPRKKGLADNGVARIDGMNHVVGSRS